jgi:hypothetical protein
MLVVRGESLRSALSIREQADDYSDVPPIKDSCLSALKDVVSHHNVLVGMDSELSLIDGLLPGPANLGPVIKPDVLKSILSQTITVEITSTDAHDALEEITQEAKSQPTNDRAVARASESGETL